MTGTWKKVADRNGTYTLSAGVHNVRYGSTTKWMHRQDSGTGRCTSDYLDYWGPHPVNECQVFVPDRPSSPAPVPGGGPMIDVAKIPFGSAGTSLERVRSTNEVPSGSDGTGAFRTLCDYSHMAFDDPIVKPGQPGASHLHMFFGNTQVSGNSTASTIANSGSSTCLGGIANRSSYWVPAMIDTRDGTPLAHVTANFYYKTGYNNIPTASIKALPPGLRMVAGDAKNTTAQGAAAYFECLGGGEHLGRSPGILNCPVGAKLVMSVFFPQCWDGTNLDSPDHRSHMSYPVEGRCPSSHPVALPEISFHIPWLVKEANAPLRWRLSSDNYSTSLPGGYSSHADWFNGWKAQIMDSWVKNCDQAAKDCHSYLIGPNQELYAD